MLGRRAGGYVRRWSRSRRPRAIRAVTPELERHGSRLPVEGIMMPQSTTPGDEGRSHELMVTEAIPAGAAPRLLLLRPAAVAASG